MIDQPAPEKRILFVDDDPAILVGLKNAFRRDRMRWDMVFALGSNAALGELALSTFDAVVSDMRMPDMSGAALLDIVKHKSPSSHRVILSGTTNSEEMGLATGSADEVLSKPCPTAMLREVLERLFAAK
jgi:DNA-binding NtrC family response regulator